MARHLFLDERYPLRMDHTNPLLKPESLRRLAWSVFYLDLVHDDRPARSVDEPRISLPCDETCFLRGLDVKANDPINSSDILNVTDLRHNECPNHTHFGLSAHLIRTAAMRYRILHYNSLAGYSPMTTTTQTLADLDDLDRSATELIKDLPPHLVHSEDNLYIHTLRRTSFLLLHMLRHSCFMILAKGRLNVCAREVELAGAATQLMRSRVRHAVAVSWISGDGLQLGVNHDPFVAVLAYEALEGEQNGLPTTLMAPGSSAL